MKINTQLKELLQQGKIAVKNDGTLEELRFVLKECFPDCNEESNGYCRYYGRDNSNENEWDCWDYTKLFPHSVKDFIEEEFVLPEKWCIKDTHEEINEWFNETRLCNYSGLNMGYMHYPKIRGFGHFYHKIKEGYTEITFEEFKKYILKMDIENRFPFKLKEEDAKRIINIACNTWKTKLSQMWGGDLLMNGHVSISEDFYKEMREACTEEQNKLFDEIFGKDNKIEYKVGDYITVVEGCKNRNGEKGNTYKITLIRGSYFYYSLTSAIDTSIVKVRKATKEEIEQYNCPYEKGDLILVRECEKECWDLMYFSHVENGEVYCFPYQEKNWDRTTKWKFHAPTPKGFKLPS